MKLTLSFLIIGILLIISTFQKPSLFQKGAIRVAPPEQIESFVFGYNQLVADLLWIRILQDGGTCEQNPEGQAAYVDDIEAEDILEAKLKPSRCTLGWFYKMLEAITNLDKKFKQAYRVGATILSISVDDREGARRIYDKGILNFPKDWVLAYRAAYHYLYEFQDAPRAADLLLQANQNGGPSWLPVLAARLYTSSGRATLGIAVLEEFLKTNPEAQARERAIKRLEILKKQLQKQSN